MKQYIASVLLLGSALSHGWVTNVEGSKRGFFTKIMDDLKARWYREETRVLFRASMCNYYDKAQEALAAGASVYAKDRYGRTPLNVAAVHAFSDNTVKLLLAAGAEVDVRDNDGNTPLSQVVPRLEVSKAALLLNNGANPNARNNEGISVLQKCGKGKYRFLSPPVLACYESEKEMKIMQLLFQHGANPQSIGLNNKDLEWWYGKDDADKMIGVQQRLNRGK
jgi:hypothetical protein